MHTVAGGGIRTPDQRLRVFVSSTLKELAAERRAVRASIERLALAPVMFELGARPHPPRELYRAYLDQSDIFVGVYWEQYGWVAPGEEVSGLEDEWNLAPDIPKLIYIKRSDHRQDRLDDLLKRIRDDDDASYVSFTDAGELADLVTGDLATLLAERFDAAGGRHTPLGEPVTEFFSTEPVRPPSPLTRILGRDRELTLVTRLLADGTAARDHHRSWRHRQEQARGGCGPRIGGHVPGWRGVRGSGTRAGRKPRHRGDRECARHP